MEISNKPVWKPNRQQRRSRGRSRIKFLESVETEIRRKKMERLVAKKVAASRAKRELRDYWRNRIAMREGVRFSRVALNSPVTNKRSMPEYSIRKPRRPYANQ